MRLSDLKIVVTGAAQGMGAYFARRLLEVGASVAAGDVSEAGLETLAADCNALPGKLFTHLLDVRDEAAITQFVQAASNALDGLNGLINNAGILRDALLVKRDKHTGEVVKLSKADWDAVIGVNLTGATFMVREVVAEMLRHDERPGVIVNMSSIARYGHRGQSNYVASKAAMAANTRTWALEFAPYGIRVGAVAPGIIETPMTRDMNPKAREHFVQAVPIGRIGQPEDIWLAVKFILECDYFTARTIDVDGGLDF